MQSLKKSFDLIPFPFFVIDADFNITGGSEEALSQFPAVANFLELVDFGSRKKAERFMKPVFASSKMELNLMTKNHSLLLYDVYTQWEGDSQIFVFCIEKQESIQQIQAIITKLEKQLETENLTLLEKQEQMENTLKKMEQVIIHHDNLNNFGKMASSIANELKRPLVSIRGFLQLLKPYLIEFEKDHYADIALEEVDHANNLIYQYLSTTSPSIPEVKQVNIQKMIMEVIDSTQGVASNIQCELNYMKEQILPVIDIDPKQIKQVMYNLITNAFDAIEGSENTGNGRITIRTMLTKNTLQISVQDNGKGIDLETKKRLFTPFFTTKEKGTGIGLAVCLKIVQNHGGIIEVQSKPGEGSTFIIVLPIEL